MPGLIRGVARTAVVAGTATAVSNRVSRRQAERWQQKGGQQPVEYRYEAQQPASQQPAAAAAPASEQDTIAQLKELAELKQQGILTEEEFAAQKAKILGS
jgi:membrane protease subunit (stomatin/prohibitin family)